MIISENDSVIEAHAMRFWHLAAYSPRRAGTFPLYIVVLGDSSSNYGNYKWKYCQELTSCELLDRIPPILLSDKLAAISFNF